MSMETIPPASPRTSLVAPLPPALSILHRLHWDDAYSANARDEYRSLIAAFTQAVHETIACFEQHTKGNTSPEFAENFYSYVKALASLLSQSVENLPSEEVVLNRENPAIEDCLQHLSDIRLDYLDNLRDLRYASSGLLPWGLSGDATWGCVYSMCDDMLNYRRAIIARLLWLHDPDFLRSDRYPAHGVRYTRDRVIMDEDMQRGLLEDDVWSSKYSWLADQSCIPNLEWLFFIRLAGFMTYWEAYGSKLLSRLLCRALDPSTEDLDSIRIFQNLDHFWAEESLDEEEEEERSLLQFRNMAVELVTTEVLAADLQDDETECSICSRRLADFGTEETELAVKTGCSHIFGKDCLQDWLDSERQNCNTCPVCRRNLCVLDLLDLLPSHVRESAMAWSTGFTDRRYDDEVDAFLLQASGAVESGVLYPSTVGEMLKHLAQQVKAQREHWRHVYEWAYVHVGLRGVIRSVNVAA
jgi:hypothetical protein